MKALAILQAAFDKRINEPGGTYQHALANIRMDDLRAVLDELSGSPLPTPAPSVTREQVEALRKEHRAGCGVYRQTAGDPDVRCNCGAQTYNLLLNDVLALFGALPTERSPEEGR